MRYETIRYFTDLKDNKHPYNVGDIFPRAGLSVSEERLKELSSDRNRQHKPLIKLVEEIETAPAFEIPNEFGENEGHQYTKSDINRMTTAALQKLAENEGIENAYEKNGGELKKILIEHFML